MPAIIICDNCGKKKKMTQFEGGWLRPISWFSRSDKDGIQTACSKSCKKRIEIKTGRSDYLFPW